MTNTWEAKQKTYRARRISAPGPGFREDKILFYDKDQRHVNSDCPNGIITPHEGLVFTAYPTPKVKSHVGSLIDEVDAAKAASVSADYIDNDAAGSIIDDPAIVQALTKAGIGTIEELVDAYLGGDLGRTRGIGAARLQKIGYDLAAAGKIEASDEA